MIKLQNITKKYQGKTILNELSGDFGKSEIIGIVGSSGVGKSSLLRLIAGIEQPDTGIVQVHGQVGMVFQDFQLFPHMTILENLLYTPIKIQKRARAECLLQAKSLLESLGILSKQHQYPAQLSGGQKQRVAIARTVIAQPEIILMDEPTSSLDPENVQKVLNLFKSLAASGTTLMIVSHELPFINQLATKMVSLQQGKLEVHATSEHKY